MLLDEGLHLRQFDPLVYADRLGWQVGRQRETAVRTRGRAVVDNGVGVLRDDPAVALVARLGAAGMGLLAALLPIGGGRLGRRARRLGRSLQLQHQLDQFVLAQALEITAAHDDKESARDAHGKRVLGPAAIPASTSRTRTPPG